MRLNTSLEQRVMVRDDFDESSGQPPLLPVEVMHRWVKRARILRKDNSVVTIEHIDQA